MKKVFYIAIATLLVAACNMDFYRSDTMTSTMLKSDPGAAVYTTDGLYSMFKDVILFEGSEYSNNTWVKHYFQLTEFRGDNVAQGRASEDPFTNIMNYTEDQGQECYNIGYFWYVSYKILFGANSNIEAIQEGATAEGDLLLGENYFIRAFVHFALANIYARPYYVEGRGTNANEPCVILRTSTDCSKTEKATIEQVYKSVEDDCNKAYQLLQGKKRRGDKGFVGEEAPLALLSRLYLYKGDWDKCIEVSEQLLGADPASKLDPNLDNLFVNAPNSVETIWCIDRAITDYQYSQHAQLGSMYYSSTGVGGVGWCEIYSSEQLVDLLYRWEDEGRRKAYFAYAAPIEGQLMVSWPEKQGAGLTYRLDVMITSSKNPDGSYTPNVTDNGDGTLTAKSGDNTYIIKKKTVNKDVKYYIEGYETDAEDQDDIEGGTRVFVRTAQDASKGTRLTMPAYMNKKFTGQGGEELLSSNIFFRYGETILNAAEAYAHKNDAVNAVKYMNYVRARAGLTGDALYTTTNLAASGYDNILDAVLDERRLELFYEGFRGYDLYRNGKDIFRKYAGVHDWEIIPNADLDNKFPCYIPYAETVVSGVTSNK
ncbi:MAG: RagB/SusD family nutrient uptake outer membrane protein [Bacteroidales bacterium]|nr:RagB/SusD family nutrient uptake outer membrane protein [Bacteroidales bacterium]